MSEFETTLLAVAFWAFWFKEPLTRLVEQLIQERHE